jgi:hypothetical protein
MHSQIEGGVVGVVGAFFLALAATGIARLIA